MEVGRGMEATRQHQFFMEQDLKVCLARFDFCRSSTGLRRVSLDLSIEQVDLLDQFDDISRVSHCKGLLLCVAKGHSKLMLCNPNPNLRQTQWIECPSPTDFQKENRYAFCYALGHDSNGNHKILMFFDLYGRAAERRYHIYELISHSWRVLEVSPDPDWKRKSNHAIISVKGNTYFYVHKTSELEKDGKLIKDTKYFLVCFDFATETFGPHLELPFHTDRGEDVAFSCLKEEKLAVLYHPKPKESNLNSRSKVRIWVTDTIDSDSLSWELFLSLEIEPYIQALPDIRFSDLFIGNNFFIIEEEKVVVVFNFNSYLSPKKAQPGSKYQRAALIIGEDGFFKPVSLGETSEPLIGNHFTWSSSYLPSSVQLNQVKE